MKEVSQVYLLRSVLNEEMYQLEKRMLDDDKDACKILAMLLEPIVSGIFEKMKKEQERDTLIQSIRMSECQPKIFNEVSNS